MLRITKHSLLLFVLVSNIVTLLSAADTHRKHPSTKPKLTRENSNKVANSNKRNIYSHRNKNSQNPGDSLLVEVNAHGVDTTGIANKVGIGSTAGVGLPKILSDNISKSSKSANIIAASGSAVQNGKVSPQKNRFAEQINLGGGTVITESDNDSVTDGLVNPNEKKGVTNIINENAPNSAPPVINSTPGTVAGSSMLSLIIAMGFD